jgi:hypothetical protein
MYSRNCVLQDDAEAVEWMRAAAEQGDARMQHRLGALFHYGYGLTEDYVEAARLYHLAADQGHVDAMCDLGEMFERGQGVAQDMAEAVRWFRLADARGSEYAQLQLRKMKPVAPDHWRHLWDGRRNSSDPQDSSHPSPPSPALPHGYKLVTAAERLSQDGGSLDAFIRDVTALLDCNYVEDDDGCFRFSLSEAFVRYTLLGPDHDLNLLFSVVYDDGCCPATVVAFMAAVPVNLRVDPLRMLPNSNSSSEPVEWAFVDLVCVERSHRGKRLCPFLYDVAARQCSSVRGIERLICTSGYVLPTPVLSSTYYHRLNPQCLSFLCDIQFAWKPSDLTMAEWSELEKRTMCQKSASDVSIRRLAADDIPIIRDAYNSFVSNRFTVARVFDTDADFAHTFLHEGGVIRSFVSASPDCNDFISFYICENKVIQPGHPLEGSKLRTAYCFYYCLGSLTLESLLNEAMLLLFSHESEPIHVVNALCGIMGYSSTILDSLQFRMGTGTLNYFVRNQLFNSALCPEDMAWFTT